MGKVPNVGIKSEIGVLWGGYGDISEMDEVTKAILQKYGPIDIYLQFAPISELTIQHYFINDTEVTSEEAQTVWECLQPQKTELVKRDFIDLSEVERILKKVRANNVI